MKIIKFKQFEVFILHLYFIICYLFYVFIQSAGQESYQILYV